MDGKWLVKSPISRVADLFFLIYLCTLEAFCEYVSLNRLFPQDDCCQGSVVDLRPHHHTSFLQAIESGSGTWKILGPRRCRSEHLQKSNV